MGRPQAKGYTHQAEARNAEACRVAAQLIEATNGAHLWAERYESDVSDIFEIQDQVSSNVAGIIGPLLRGAEADQSLLHQANHIGALLIKIFSNANFGRMALAKEVTQQVLRQRPEYNISIYRFDMVQLPPKYLDRVVDGLRLAGMPER